MSVAGEFLGRGWRFPIRPTGLARSLGFSDGAQVVRQAIVLLLETEPGERLMRPDYGVGLRRFIMRPNIEETRAQIQREVAFALQRWEPRIIVDSVRATPGSEPSLLLLEIRYTHARDRSPGNLVYPFYLE